MNDERLETKNRPELGKMVLKTYLKCKMQIVPQNPFKMQNRKWFPIFYLK